MQAEPWQGVVVSLAVALAAALGDRRHSRRRDLDRIGWVPWPLITITALIAAAVFAAAAIGR